MSIRPKSIRGKLLLAFLLAAAPVLGVQVAEYVHAFRRTQEAAMRNGNIWLAASVAAVVLGMAVLFIVGNRVTQPVRRLARAAQALAVGDFRKRVSIRSADELEVLADSFNSLGESLAAREAGLRQTLAIFGGMAEAARMASSVLDPKECARAIARVVCSHLGAQAAAVYLRDAAEGGVKAAASCLDRPTAAWARLAAHSASSGEYLVMAEKRAGVDAWLAGIPMTSGESAVGAIIARYEGVARDDLHVGGVLADALTAFGVHAAAAVANAQAYSRSENYSEVLEDWVDHLSSVMQVTDAISPALNLQEALDVLAEQTLNALGADGCSIVLPNHAGELVIRAVSSKPGVKFVPTGTVLDINKTEVGLAYAERRLVSCSDTCHSSRSQTAELHRKCGYKSVLCAPLLFQGESVGAITVSMCESREFSPHDIRLLTSIGTHAAVIVRNATLYTKESLIAESLQQGLVSVAPERLGSLAFAGRYVPAFDEARIGGDFFDVLELDGSRVFVVMADVSGKGLSAAIHLAETKYMLKAIVAQHPDDPGMVLRDLNYVMNRAPDMGFFVTAFCAVIDVENHTLCFANAGHPPGLLLSRHGQMHTCLNTTGIPVGTGYACDYATRTVGFEPADTLLLYTDGVIESRMSGEELGVEGLHKLVFEVGDIGARGLVDHLGIVLVDSNQKDDVALLAVSFEPCIGSAVETDGGQDEQEQVAAAR